MQQPQRQLLVYFDGTCTDHVNSLNADFTLLPVTSVVESVQQLALSRPILGVILHFNILSQDQIITIEKICAFVKWLPIFVLADHLELDAVRDCGRIGVDAVLGCENMLGCY